MQNCSERPACGRQELRYNLDYIIAIVNEQFG